MIIIELFPLQEISIDFDQTQEIETNLEIGHSTIIPQPEYAGPYEVTPTVDGFVLGTKDKSMSEDLSVLAIPYQEVSNPQGGETVIIAFD